MPEPTGADWPAILILVPYFGPWPEWIEVFIETCRGNPAIDWLVLTDQEPPEDRSPNVRYQALTLPRLERLVVQRLGIRVPLPRPYKICDLRLAFLKLFEDCARGYDYVGWSDIDILYGDLQSYLRPLLAHELISFNAAHLSGHLTLVRNTAKVRELLTALPDWTSKVGSPEYQHLDEPAPEAFAGRLAVSARESFNTPLSPLIPWRDGRFVFPREWYWRSGRLTNDLDAGAEFPYLHFMHWKGGEWPRQCGNAHWERVERIMNLDSRRIREGFRVNELGFFPLAAAGIPS